MDSTEDECIGKKLPPEILHKIFDLLDGASVKNAARTCSYWARVFGSYCSRRFLLHICEEVCRPWAIRRLYTTDCSRQCMYYMQREQNVKHRSHTVGLEEIAHILQHSTRNYTTLHLDVFYDELHDVHMNSVLSTVFNEDWTSRLRILKLGLGSSSERYAPAISAALPKMVGLKELLLICAPTFPATKYFPDLRLENDTLERLVLLTVLPGVINCPKLRVLQVSAHLDVESAFGKQYAQHAGEEPFWKVRQLEHFTISLQKLPKCGAADDTSSQTENRPGYKMLFYQQLTKLRKLEIYEVLVPQKVFQGICEHCSSLEELTLHDLKLIDPEALQDLSKLSRLQRLAIYKLHTTRPISFANVQAPRLAEVLLGREVEVHRDSQQHLKHLIVNVKDPHIPRGDCIDCKLDCALATKSLNFWPRMAMSFKGNVFGSATISVDDSTWAKALQNRNYSEYLNLVFGQAWSIHENGRKSTISSPATVNLVLNSKKPPRVPDTKSARGA